jgi:predicted ester cyclase
MSLAGRSLFAGQAMNFYRFSGGKIIEERGQPDLLGLMQQIGSIPM